MDFKSIIFSFFASLFLVLQRVIHLIFFPYKTMRKISLEKDLTQVGIIFFLVLVYFLTANTFRSFDYPPLFLFFVTCIHFLMAIIFFYGMTKFFNKDISFQPFIFTFAYTLIPTLCWFWASSFLYEILPPPRTLSILGRSFSVVYLTFSISMFIWKLILWYLAVRFSTKLAFYRIMYLMILFASIAAPYSIVLYGIKMFRIPFI